jgi:FtsP/CotA-like multicopper oxidase with cupredoxin domain
MILFLLSCTFDGLDQSVEYSETRQAISFASEQPIFQEHPEAEDLNPEPNIFQMDLTAARKQHKIVDWTRDETIVVDGYAYNDLLPGPTIRVKIGDRVIIAFQNDLDDPTTIHWHGLQVPEDMDGVPWNRDPVMPGESYNYEFTVQTAGTFWYHPHFDTEHQANHGLYGAFIVEDPADPDLRGVPLILDDWPFPYQDDDLNEEHFNQKHLEGVWTVNGVVNPKIQLSDSHRLRLINSSNTGFLDLAMEDAQWIGSDQGLRSQATGLDELLLVTGDRADILTNGGVLSAHPYSHLGGERFGESKALFTVESELPVYSLSDWNFSQETPTPDSGRTDGYYSFQGDPRTSRWLINGEVFPEITIQEFAFGTTQTLEIRNVSATEHPFHLHGLKFEILSVNGTAPDFRQIEDTFNIRPFQRVRILVEMDNLGDWMTHCHILPHAENGMMTVLRVK